MLAAEPLLAPRFGSAIAIADAGSRREAVDGPWRALEDRGVPIRARKPVAILNDMDICV